jgi:4-hydroxythreonine-4-phosphate dehydrogenase
MQVFTKSGGFGGENALVEAADALFGRPEPPVLGITMGDPCGIGPEVVARALNEPKSRELCRPLVIGSAAVMEKAVEITEVNLKIRAVKSVSEARFPARAKWTFWTRTGDIAALKYGIVDPMGGEACLSGGGDVIALAMSGEIDGTVTAPLNKEALNLAGHHYSGHTEILRGFDPYEGLRDGAGPRRF